MIERLIGYGVLIYLKNLVLIYVIYLFFDYQLTANLLLQNYHATVQCRKRQLLINNPQSDRHHTKYHVAYRYADEV